MRDIGIARKSRKVDQEKKGGKKYTYKDLIVIYHVLLLYCIILIVPKQTSMAK